MERWNKVYDVLVEVCGAEDTQYAREHFKWGQYKHDIDRMHVETRFIGALGLGGKFHRSIKDRRWYVSCYPENSTPEREAMIKQANENLAALHEQFCHAN